MFLRPSPLFALCVPAEGQVGRTLLRPQFGLCRLDWGRSAEFNLPHGEMLRLLRFHGFMVEDLIEIQAPREARRDYPQVSADWAHNWPSEEIWKTRLADRATKSWPPSPRRGCNINLPSQPSRQMTNCVVQASQLSAIQDLNFDLERRGELTPENGWHLDDYCQPLPPSRPAGRCPTAAGRPHGS